MKIIVNEALILKNQFCDQIVAELQIFDVSPSSGSNLVYNSVSIISNNNYLIGPNLGGPNVGATPPPLAPIYRAAHN